MAGLPPLPPRDRRGFEVAIVCALRLEADCVQAIFDKFWEDEGKQYGQAEGDQNSYTTGVIGKHNVVLAYLSGMGPVSASGTAAYMRSSFPNIKLALLVGICGGVPLKPDGEEIILGDVVIGQSVVQFDFGRQYPGLFEPKHDLEETLGRPSQQIRSFLHKLQTRRYRAKMEEDMCCYLTDIQDKLPDSKYPGRDADKLYVSSYQHKHHNQAGTPFCDECSQEETITCSDARKSTCSELGCDQEKLVSRARLTPPTSLFTSEGPKSQTRCVPRVHVGRIASGNKVMKWAGERDRIAQLNGVIAYEMEAAGLWEHFPSILIKGVCDYADSHKSKLWQGYSAAVAAACAKCLLTEWAFEEEWQAKDALPIFHVPFDRLQAFVGRGNVLQVLESKLAKSGQYQRIALLGLGGVGKSQVALELAYRTKLRQPQLQIFWVQATDPLTFEKDLFEIGKRLHIPGIEADKANVRALVNQRLSQKSAGEWLMILDNADDETIWGLKGILAGYLARSTQGSILVTTRNRRVAVNLAGKDIIEVHEVGHTDGIQMLRNNLAKPETMTDMYATLSLLARLTYLPLAIIQAAAYITTNDNSIEQYLDILNDSEEEAIELLSDDFNADGRYTTATNPVLLTWLISFEQLRDRSTLAAHYISYMSCLGETAIPQSLLPAAPSKASMNAAIGAIKAYMMISERSGSQNPDIMYEMHPLVRLATRNWLRNQKSLEHWTETAIFRAAELFPKVRHRLKDLQALYMPHAQLLTDSDFGNDLIQRYDLIESMAVWLDWHSKSDQAVTLLSVVVLWREKHLGREDELTLTACDNLGAALRTRGDWADAEKYHRRALNGHRMKLGKEHPLTLRSMTSLASVHRSQGQFQKAETLYRAALEINERVRGIKHISTLRTQIKLVEIHQRQGRWTEAEKIRSRLNEITQAVLGPEHPLTESNMEQLAVVYEHQGKFAEAEQLLMQVAEARKSTYGPNHSATLGTITRLANTYKRQERLADAERLQIYVKHEWQKVLGNEHPETLYASSNLAITYQIQNRWTEAEQLQVEVVEIMRKAQRAEHPDTLTCMGNLALTYRAQNRLDEAETLNNEIIEMRRRVLGAEHPDTLTCMGNLALTYMAQERFDEAERLNIEVIETKRRIHEAEHPDTLTFMGNLALTYQAQNRLEEAEALNKEVIEARKRVLGIRHSHTLSSMRRLAAICENQGRWDDASELYSPVVEMMKEIHGSEHPDTLSDMHELGRIHFYQGRFEDAKQLFSVVMEMETRSLGRDHPDTLRTMENMVKALGNQGHPEQALELQSQLLDMSIDALGPENPDTLLRLDILREILASQCTTEEVEEFVRPYLEKMNLKRDQSDTTAQSDHKLQEASKEVGRHERCSGNNCRYCYEPGLDDVD